LSGHSRALSIVYTRRGPSPPGEVRCSQAVFTGFGLFGRVTGRKCRHLAHGPGHLLAAASLRIRRRACSPAPLRVLSRISQVTWRPPC
jgi:hypothetical protein